MQRERTLQFWDEYHHDNQKKEWIVEPSHELIQLLVDTIMVNAKHGTLGKEEDASTHRRHLRILEIGCGTSRLARSVWNHLQNCGIIHSESSSSSSSWTITMCASDVSETCIQTNRQRDQEDMQNNNGLVSTTDTIGNSTFRYQVCNVLEANDEMRGQWDVILDKGCIDTLLFRSRQRGENHVYTNLMQTVLDNIYQWLSPHSHSIYLLISPRSKIRAVRDFAGFESPVRRHSLPKTNWTATTSTRQEDQEFLVKGGRPIQKQNQKPRDTPGYLFVCRKHSDYQPGISSPFPGDYRRVPDEDSKCHCGITFYQFRKGEAVEGRGQVFWTREWKNHCIHCKAPHKNHWS